jgi:hypothetical protein
MGIFNKDTFMDTPVQGANSTQRLTFDPGVYPAVIEEVSVDNGEKDGREWAKLNLKLGFYDPEILAKMKRDKVSLTYGFFLDLTDLGTIDEGEGKNVPLGKVRKAVDQNREGDGWTPRLLVGQQLLASVVAKPVLNSTDGEMRNEVVGISKL